MTYNAHKFATLVDKLAKKLDPTSDYALLSDPSLEDAVMALVLPCMGPEVTTVRVTAWHNGSTDTEGGETEEQTWAAFAGDIVKLASEVVEKSRQPYFTQGVSPSGRRNNASIKEMTVLAFDCDDRGGWSTLRETLDVLGFAYILYQSSGYRAGGADRWRAVLPLSKPVDVSTSELQHAWKHAYRCIRTLFGHVAGLTLEGFDPCLATPSQPVYAGCRKCEDTPAREVVYCEGKTFDMGSFLGLIPPAPVFVPATEASDEFPETAYYFLEAGWLGEQHGNKFYVRCPWNADHSVPLGPTESPTDKAVVFFPSEGNTAGMFTCFSHGSHTIKQIKAALPMDVVARGEARAQEARIKAFQQFRQETTGTPEGSKLSNFPVLPDNELVHKWDEIGNAHRFARDFGHLCRFDKDRGHWLVYDGKRWVTDKSDATAQRHAVTSIKRMYKVLEETDPDLKKAYKKFITATSTYRGVTNMLRIARTVPGMSVGADVWDSDPYILNVDNGTLDLRSCTLRAHDSADLLTRICPVAYDPGAKSPVWDNYLKRIIPSPDVRAYLSRVFGYTTTGVTSEHCMHVLHGSGSNGKSTMVDVIGYALGDYFASTDASTFLAQRNDAPRNDLAALVGARMVSASETDVGRSLSEATVKVCTGGDSVTCRFLHKEFFSYVPQYKVFLMSNSKPKITGGDEGIWRRMRLVPFEVSILEGERDKTLKDKLRAESTGVLRWIIDGFKDWQVNGLCPPSEIKAATAEYREEMDPTADWFSSRCVIDLNDDTLFESFKDLYQSYQQHALLDSVDVVDFQAFAQFLNSRGLLPARKKIAGKIIRGRLGIMIKGVGHVKPSEVGPS